ncbi:MAG: amidohydrolase, partial [Saprospiraceae bacterium]
GIVGIFKNGEGPLILYRSDMDALPMDEKTDLSFASEKKVNYNGNQVGTMHSCGHDMHMTSLVGTARTMVKMKDHWNGTLMMIGQPAEELGKGAALMLGAGLYEKFGVPDYGIGLHCSPTIASGQLGIREGFSMATTESADIIVHGLGGHGAAPHMTIDPVVIASMIVMDLQTIVSRNLKPTASAVITVGSFKSGHKHNIIPDEAHLKLTIRTYKEEVRLMVHKRIQEIAKGVAIAAGLPEDKMPDVIFGDSSTPANYNNPSLTAMLQKSASKAIGSENVIDAEPQMVGEDFSRYGSTEHKVPTVLYWLGTVSEDKMKKGNLPGLHSPFYYPDLEKSLTTAIKVNTQTLIDLFNG